MDDEQKPIFENAYYFEIAFTAGAGSIRAGGDSGGIQTRNSKTDWSSFNEANDYSFDPAKTAFANWEKVTLYRNGQLVRVTEPHLKTSETPLVQPVWTVSISAAQERFLHCISPTAVGIPNCYRQ